jgi:hypothetical protein
MGKFAILRKKETWSTTWLGKLLILAILVLGCWMFMMNIHAFLSQNSPVNSDIMVVEGFLPDFAIGESAKIFNDGNYKLMIVTGKKMIKGSSLTPFENDGLFTVAILGKMGFDTTRVKVIALENDVKKDRTFASAKAVLNWINKSELNPRRINLVSLGCHARRSRMMFDKAFANEIEVGIIVIPEIAYDPENWWKSSYGFKTVLNEFLAWTYAHFFFRSSG